MNILAYVRKSIYTELYFRLFTEVVSFKFTLFHRVARMLTRVEQACRLDGEDTVPKFTKPAPLQPNQNTKDF